MPSTKDTKSSSLGASPTITNNGQFENKQRRAHAHTLFKFNRFYMTFEILSNSPSPGRHSGYKCAQSVPNSPACLACTYSRSDSSSLGLSQELARKTFMIIVGERRWTVYWAPRHSRQYQMDDFIEHIIAFDGMFGRFANRFQQTQSSRLALVVEVHFQGSVKQTPRQILGICAVCIVLSTLVDEWSRESIPQKNHARNGHILRLIIIGQIQRTPIDTIACFYGRQKSQDNLRKQLKRNQWNIICLIYKWNDVKFKYV